ncbi:hypothetical protein L9F63_021302, partial [Diploptera punctata]
ILYFIYSLEMGSVSLRLYLLRHIPLIFKGIRTREISPFVNGLEEWTIVLPVYLNSSRLRISQLSGNRLFHAMLSLLSIN